MSTQLFLVTLPRSIHGEPRGVFRPLKEYPGRYRLLDRQSSENGEPQTRHRPTFQMSNIKQQVNTPGGSQRFWKQQGAIKCLNLESSDLGTLKTKLTDNSQQDFPSRDR